MKRVTKDSPKPELRDALNKVIIAIEALRLIADLGLATANTIASIEDLKVYEGQLLDYLAG